MRILAVDVGSTSTVVVEEDRAAAGAVGTKLLCETRGWAPPSGFRRLAGLSIFTLWLLPGVFLEWLTLILADQVGISFALLLLLPIFAVGALVLSSAGSTVEADIRAATAASLAAEISRRSKEEGRAKLVVANDTLPSSPGTS